MKTIKSSFILLTFIILITSNGCLEKRNTFKDDLSNMYVYQPTWESLKLHPTPRWLRDGKFGIYTHWGIYAVHAMGENATWYSHNVYMNEKGWEREDFENKYGKLSDGIGYKDLIPMFTAEKFNAEEWADLFVKSGAKFAGPVAEHHDGFAMWDTRYSEWNAFKMGPRRDIVGELAEAIKARDMKFVTAFHHAANWDFFPVWDTRYDCSNPEYSGLYGQLHEKGDEPAPEFLDEWQGKLIEVIDKYEPDYIWFDFALDIIRENYVKEVVAYYYNKALKHNREVIISYKHHDLPAGAGILDLELGQEPVLTHYEWITDTSVDDQGAWGFVSAAEYKSINRLVDNLVDRVSKNGYLLLNVGPKADGTIPAEAREKLLGIGEWLEVNGEAIYGTTAWRIAGEGPTNLEPGKEGDAMFNESDVEYTYEDIRFTVKGDVIYAITLDWPGDRCRIATFSNRERRPLTNNPLHRNEISRISMLGDGKDLKWYYDETGLIIETPDKKPCEHAFVFKIERRND